MFRTKPFLGLAVAMASLLSQASTAAAQPVAAAPQVPMTVPLYAYGPVIAAPAPAEQSRQRNWRDYARPYPYPYSYPYRYPYAAPGAGYRAPTYRYGSPYGGWQVARPYYYGYRGAPYYRYRWTERRSPAGSQRFAARILTPQPRAGLLYEARRY